MPEKRRQFYRYWQVRAAQRTDLTPSEGFAEVLKKPSLLFENLAAANSFSTSQRQPGCVAGVWARSAASARAARGLPWASCCAGRGEVVLGSRLCCQHPLLQCSVALCRGGCFRSAGQAWILSGQIKLAGWSLALQLTAWVKQKCVGHVGTCMKVLRPESHCCWNLFTSIPRLHEMRFVTTSSRCSVPSCPMAPVHKQWNSGVGFCTWADSGFNDCSIQQFSSCTGHYECLFVSTNYKGSSRWLVQEVMSGQPCTMPAPLTDSSWDLSGLEEAVAPCCGFVFQQLGSLCFSWRVHDSNKNRQRTSEMAGLMRYVWKVPGACPLKTVWILRRESQASFQTACFGKAVLLLTWWVA